MKAAALTRVDSTESWTRVETGEHPVAKNRCGITKFGTVCAFLKNGTCSKTLMTVLNREFKNPLLAEEKASASLAGGLMHGYQCGMLWGSTLAAGAEAFRKYGPGKDANAATLRAAMGIVGAFRSCHDTVDCMDITDTDPQNGWQVFVHFFVKGGTFRCMARAAEFAPLAHEQIENALANGSSDSTSHCSGCAARLAQRAGASPLQQTMVAGLAGGIGLCGGACGALGAAIWLIGLRGQELGWSQKELNRNIHEIEERFLRVSDYEFECQEIVGKKFANWGDHEDYLTEGGCRNLIDALVQYLQEMVEN